MEGGLTTKIKNIIIKKKNLERGGGWGSGPLGPHLSPSLACLYSYVRGVTIFAISKRRFDVMGLPFV